MKSILEQIREIIADLEAARDSQKQIAEENRHRTTAHHAYKYHAADAAASAYENAIGIIKQKLNLNV